MKAKFHKYAKPDVYINLNNAKSRYEGRPSLALGRVKGNLAKNTFTFYDDGNSMKVARGKLDVRRELGVCLTSIQKMKLRHMDIVTPVLNTDYGPAQFRPLRHNETMAHLFKKGNRRNMYLQNNRHPKWNERKKCLTLNFGDRVKLPSVKNCIIEDRDGTMTLLFGKVTDEQYSLDVAHPLSVFQGVCIALASIYAKHG